MLRNFFKFITAVFLLALFLFPQNSFAQLTGTKNIPGDYATLELAVADLNTQGVGAGGVTLNLLAGNPQTAPVGGYIIGGTGSAVLTTSSSTNTIVFQGNGNTITAFAPQVAGTLHDAIFELNGADWITLTGFVMMENAANTVTAAATNDMTEFGVALFYVTTTDGAQNNKIINCTIDLNRTYQNTFGVYSNSTHSSTVITTVASGTGALGGNHGLVIQANNITDVNLGIVVVGPTAAADMNNVVTIGGSAPNANIITNFGTTGTFSGYANVSGTVNGILIRNSINYDVSYNTVTSSVGGVTVGTLNGIQQPAFSTTPTGTFTNSINNNTISLQSGLIAGGMNGISCPSGSASTTSIFNINNNNFQTFGHTVAGTGAITFITNASIHLTQSISNNTFTNITVNTTGSVTFISNSNTLPAGGLKNVNNNSIVTAFNKTGAGGTITLFTDNGSDPLGAVNNTNNNNFSNITVTGATTIAGWGNTNGGSPTKNVIGNTFSNWTGGTSAITGLSINFDAGITTVTSNTVSNITGAGAITGILFGSSGTAGTTNASLNTVHTLTSTGAAVVSGFAIGGAATVSRNIFRNSVYNLACNNAGGSVNGMLISSGTIYVYNNFISDLRAPSATLAVEPIAQVRGINITSTTATSTVGVYYNSIYLNAASTGTNFGSAGIFHTTSTTATTAALDMRDNVIVNNSTPAGTGLTVAYRRSSTALTNYGSASNNNDFYAGVPSATNLIFFDGTNSDQTMVTYKARVAPRDAASFTENPPFVNVSTTPYDLHMNTLVATQTESGGTPVTTPVAITDDFDGNTRNVTTPDVGADEFAGIALDLTPPAIVYTPLLNTGSTSSRTLVVTVTDPSGVPTTAPGWPNLYWMKTGDISWTAATPTSVVGSAYTYSFGAGVTIGDVVSYYVVAQDGAATPNVGAFPSAGAGGFTANPPAAATPPTTPSSYLITNTALSGDYTVGLLMFNQITGKNIYFDKVVTKVMKEVDVEVPVVLKPVEKGKEPQNTENTTSYKPQTIKQLREVEEISWIPMENGQPYLGDLYVKKFENPQLSFPDGTDGVYSTITAAVADLNLRGVSGATTFLLNDATYPTETFPITINVTNESKPTSTNTVTIKPNTSVTSLVQGASAASQIFKILNSYVTIDGSNSGGTDRSLTIENTSATTPQVVVIGSTGTTPITNVTLKNCIVINGVNSSSAVIVSDGTTPGTAGWFNNITIQNNSVQKAYIGVYCITVIASGNGSGLLLTGNDLTTSGTNAIRLVGLYAQGIDGATVTNNSVSFANTVDASNITGTWFATGTVNSTLSNNTFGPISGTLGGPRGIVITSAVVNANINVTGNTITGMTTPSTGVTYGVFVFSTTSGVTIEKNKISNIKNTNAGGYSAIGIALGSTLTAANITASNNFIWDVAGYGYSSTTTDNGFGINILSGAGYNLYFNSVGLSTEQTSATGNPACLIINSAVTTAASLDIRDNIFATFQTVGAQRYAVLCNAANTVFSNINYNDYFSAGPNLGYIGATNRLDLAAWQAGTLQDLQSISGNPGFVSVANLHIDPSSNVVSNNGFYLASVPTDIDGDARSVTTPDIGADEYTYVPPTVNDPTGVTATTISDTQIDVAFTATELVNNVVIVFNLDGVFTAPSGTPPAPGNPFAGGTLIYNGTTSPYNHTSLSGSTTYYYKLFSYNSSLVLYSPGVTANATTLCGVYSTPWTQDFESGVFPPLCWTISPATPLLWNSSSGLAAGISGYGVGTASAWADFWGISSTTPVDLISLDYDASGLTNPQVKFDWAFDRYFTSTDELQIHYSNDAGTTWVLLARGMPDSSGTGFFNLVTVSNGITSEYGAAANPVLPGHWNTIAFGLPVGTNKVKFTAISDFGNNLFVDNIKVEQAPSHDIGVTALARNFGTLLESYVATGTSREMAESLVDKNGNKIENVSIRILYPEQKENSPESTVNLLAVVENFGGATENSYQVGWYIDGTPQTSVSNTQPLEVGDIDTLTLTWATATGGSHNARAWTVLGTDANAANDSSGILGFFVCPDNSIFCEQFEQGLVPPTGWVTYNQDGGTFTPWFVGNPTVFSAYEGTGYIGNNYQRANGFYLDDWLVTSNTGGIPLDNANVDSLVFWMRSPTGSIYPDSVQIRVSTTGQAVADFTIVLDYFMVPTTGWTRFAYALPDAANRYIAFRYLLYDGGVFGNSSDYIGLDLVQILRYQISNTFQLSVNVTNGWNMVSIPGLHPTDQNVGTWWQYRDMTANVFKYAGGYQAVATATPGLGYWMKHSGDRTYNTGDEWPAGGIQIVPHDPLAGAALWNLIGGYELSVLTANITTVPAGQQSGPVYKYSGGYQVAATLDPGYGYWIKLLSAAQIIIPEVLAKGTEPIEYFPDDWGKIVLTDASGVNYTLYAVKGETDLSQYELPPAPMAGMFDIRYSSGRIAEDINSAIKTIEMSGVTYPLTVRVEGMDIRLQDETGKQINVNLKSGEDLVIENATITKLMVSGELIPAKYALEQNYPNPFNPSTVIEFSLPEDVGNVKLSIYNTLGEKVAELVNTALVAGKYSYQWNVPQSGVATGMYIYELRTDKFVSVKKMLLLK